MEDSNNLHAPWRIVTTFMTHGGKPVNSAKAYTRALHLVALCFHHSSSPKEKV